MKCEGEKTYDKAGKCPKCGMALEELKKKEDHKHDDSHKH
jgi:transcription initiation factor IIE alpha subunit